MAVAAIVAAPIATLLAPGVAHALPATYCKWTGAASANWNTSANWNSVDSGPTLGCNGPSGVPAAGDNLNFPVDTAVNFNPVNNIVAGTSFGSITFSGAGGVQSFNITGNAFTLTGDVTDTSDQGNIIANDITLTGTSTFNVANVVLDSFSGVVSGSGSIIKAGLGSLSFANLTATGALAVNTGLVQVSATSAADATISGVTVASGANFGYDAFTNSGVTTYTFSKPITSAGTLDFQGGTTGATLTLNLTGTITLTGDTTLLASDGTTVHIQGPLHGPGFVLSATTAKSVLNESTDNTTDTPSGELIVSDDATDSDAGAPDTGFMLVAAHPLTTLAITIASAGAIFAVARLTRKSVSRR